MAGILVSQLLDITIDTSLRCSGIECAIDLGSDVTTNLALVTGSIIGLAEGNFCDFPLGAVVWS